MRIDAPQETFEVKLNAPEGVYTVCYEAVDQWDGRIKMTIGGVAVRGEVLLSEVKADGGRAFMGPTRL